MADIEFQSRKLRDSFYDTVNMARTDSGEYLMRGSIGTYSTYSEFGIRYDRNDVRDFEQFGEFITMFKGKHM